MGPPARAGLTFLNEVGLDPGIDHMSALRIIHGIEGRGGTVTSFRSYCGALPAPEADTNPWGYKFSWSPRGVILAGRNSARYLEDGEEKLLPGDGCSRGTGSSTSRASVSSRPTTTATPSRTSRPTGSTGRARHVPGHACATPGGATPCRSWPTSATSTSTTSTPLPATYADLTAALAQVPAGGGLAARVAEILDVDVASDTVTRMEWLGLFADDPIPWDDVPTRSPLDALASRMLLLMPLGRASAISASCSTRSSGSSRRGRVRTITSTLVAFGEPGGDSAIARTVGLPAAIAATMVLDGRIADRGVLVPVLPSIYAPILDELAASAGVVFNERTERRVRHGRGGARGEERRRPPPSTARGLSRSRIEPRSALADSNRAPLLLRSAPGRSGTIICPSRGGPRPPRDGRATMGRSQVVRHRVLVPAFGGSNPPAPATDLAARDHRMTTRVDT